MKHIIIGGLIIILSIFIVKLSSSLFIERDYSTVIEGYILDSEFKGIKLINPLLVRNSQLEKDVANLIYEPLFRLDSSGSLIPVLAESVVDESTDLANVIHIKLKNNIYWQNSNETLTSDDVLETVKWLKTLGNETSASKLVNQVNIEKINDLEFKFVLEKPDAEWNIIPTFYEDLSFGIMSSTQLKKFTPPTLLKHPVNFQPVGTGPMILKDIDEINHRLTFIRNEKYRTLPRYKSLVIKLFDTDSDAEMALIANQVDFVTNFSSGVLKKLEQDIIQKSVNNLIVEKSAPIYDRYFALYINNRKITDVLQRKAIYYGIDKDKLIDVMSGSIEKAKGPIPENSWAYWAVDNDYSKDTALTALSGSKPSYTLTYVDSFDRELVAKAIKSNLSELGIDIKLNPQTLKNINENIIPLRDYELLLYGTKTYIDPDRYNLWSSSEISGSGLNIANYISEKKLLNPVTQERDNKVDSVLNRARTTKVQKLRLDYYKLFQQIFNEEYPSVVLYHPKHIIVRSTKLESMNIAKDFDVKYRYLKYIY